MLATMSERPAASEDEVPIVPSPAARLTGRALGIDVGGTGIKAAVVDVASGQLVTERIRELTPRPATPEAVLDVVADVVRQLEATGKLTAGMPGGAGFPSVIKAGHAMSATNLDPSWIGAPVQEMLADRLGRPMVVLNDADAAGVAEMAYGAGKGQSGVVLLLALGTGIGSALLVDWGACPGNMQLGLRGVPGPRCGDPPVARGAHPAEDRLEEVGRRVQRASRPIRGVPLAGSHHPGRRPGQGVREVPEVPQDERPAGPRGDGATRRASSGPPGVGGNVVRG